MPRLEIYQQIHLKYESDVDYPCGYLLSLI